MALRQQQHQPIGDAATENLSNVFRLTNTNGENVFNVSVNGISGIELPTDFMLAPPLQKHCNRASIKFKIPLLVTVGGVTVNMIQLPTVSPL